MIRSSGLLNILVQDILQIDSDIIVFSAHPSLRAGSGVSGVIHTASGRELESEAIKFAPLKVGESIVTQGFGLKAKYVIHTVCPRFIYGDVAEESLLSQSYRSALSLVTEVKDAKSIAFVSLGTGVYRWPVAKAARIAIKELLQSKFDTTSLCLTDEIVSLAYQEEYMKQFSE